MSKTWKLLLALLVAGSVLVACGGDDDDATGASAGDDSKGDVDVDDVAAFAASDCAGVASAMAAATVGASSAFTGAATDLDDTVRQLQAAADKMPDEISGDMKLLAEAYGEIVAAFSDAGFDPAAGKPPTEEQMQALQDMSERFDDPKFDEASDNVSAWIEDNCG